MLNAKRTANAVYNNIPYNTQRMQELEQQWGLTNVDWEPYTLFVNGNVGNVNDCSQAQFEASITYDTVDLQGSPVYVYMRNGQYVAWYDEELEYGYIDC